MILGAYSIEQRSATQGMIIPHLDYKVSEVQGDKAISYGASGAGYDIRLAKVFGYRKSVGYSHIDPKDASSVTLTEKKVYHDAYVLLEAHEVALGVSVERFRIPTDVICLCVGKSTYARVHVIPHVTPLEQGWGTNSEEGNYLTIELANLSNERVAVYLNEGILQVLFFQVDEESTYEGYYVSQSEQRVYRATEVETISEQDEQRDDSSGACQLSIDWSK